MAASTDKIRAILTQKWIALSGIHGVENYINYTRTGFPVIPGQLMDSTCNLQDQKIDLSLSEYKLVMCQLTSAQITTQGPFWYVP
jgi:hypothetical protein